MPITRPPTPEEAAWYKSQGIDPSTVQLTVDDSGQQQQNSGDLGIARSALAPLIARAGGIVGTGLGGLVTGALAGTEFGPPGMIVGGLIGAGLGGLGGQKAQQAIVPTATQQALEQEAQEAYQQHPLVAGASELGATALAGGGRFSLSPIRAALSGSRSALRNLAIANAINVGGGLGMNAATQLYNTGQINPRELGVGALENLAAGSFFANPSRWGKIATRGQWRDIDTAAEDVQSQQEEPDENAGPLSPIGEQALALSKQSTDEAVQVRNNAAFLQNNDSAINEALRIQRAKNNADIVLDNTAFPDSLLNKNFKKLYKPVTGDMTDQANAMAYNNGLKSMNNAQRRQFMYQKMLENISPDVANAHKDYQQYWTDVTKRQDQEWVNAQNSRIMQAQIAQEREQQATQERSQAAEQYAKEQKAVKAQQEAEAWRQQNLFNVEQNRQQNITRQALAGGPASQERVEKTNLPENAAQGALSEVGRPEQVATGEGRELPQVTPEENQAALEHDELQARLSKYNPDDIEAALRKGTITPEEAQEFQQAITETTTKPEQATPQVTQTALNGLRKVQGANISRAMDLLGASMYDKNQSRTTVKELVQNAFDSVTGRPNPEIAMRIDRPNRIISIGDTGKGMTPEIIATKLLPAFESGKESTQSAGGYGLAKISFFGNSESFVADTVSQHGNTKLHSTVSGTGKAWQNFINTGAEIPADINKPGDYDLNGIKLRVENAPANAETYTRLHIKIPPDKFDSEAARSTFDQIARSEPRNIKFVRTMAHEYERRPFEESSKALGEQTGYAHIESDTVTPVQKTIDVPGATVEIKYDTNEQPENQYKFAVTNRGLHQFDLAHLQDVKLPKITINVNPNVPVTDPNYPFTNNRDALKGPARTEVDKAIKDISNTYKQSVISKFQKTTESAVKIPYSDQRFLDISGKLSKIQIQALVQHPVLKALNRILAHAHQDAFDYLNKRMGDYWSKATFAGFANGGGFQGVRFGTPSAGSKGEIYYDLHHIFEAALGGVSDGQYLPDEASLAVGEHLSGVMLHEVAHQISSYEGETHSHAMTAMGGRLANILRSTINTIQRAFTPEQLHDFIKYYEQLTAEAKLSANEESDIIRQGQSSEPTGQEFPARTRPTDTGDVASRITELEQRARTLTPGTPEHTKTLVDLTNLKVAHDPNIHSLEDKVLSFKLPEPEGNKTKADILTRTVGRVTRAGIDAVKAIGVTGKKVAPMLQGTFDDYHPIFGKHWTPEHMTTRKLTDVQLKHVDQILQLENLRKADHSFMLRSDVEKRAYRVIRDHLDEQGDERIALKAPIWENGVPREFIKDPWYYPNTQNRRMYDGLRQGDEKIIAEAKAAFIPHQQQYNPKGKYYGFSKVWSDHLASNPQDIVNKELQAQMKEQYASTGKGYETLWNDHLNSVQGSGKYMNNPSLAIYAAVRRPERIPLPDIMRNTNVRENLFSYNRRYAMDSSFYKNIENNPEVSPHLGFTTDGWGKPINTEGKNNIAGNSTVRTILEMIHGEVEPLLQRNESAVENVANAFILGPLTEIHKMISPIGQSFTFAHNPVEAAKSFVYAISHLGEGWSHALENGIVIHKPNDILDFTKANLTFAEKVNAFANAFRKIYTLNGLTERFSVGYAQAASEYLVRSKLVGARYGSETDINLLKRLDPQWTKDTQYTDPKVDELASRLAGYLIGTKDPRTLPAWLLHDNEISAFFKLLNWNVAQTNNFFNNAWTPAMKGDILPLIMTTFGASLGGYVIRELRTKLSGRPMQIPSLSDIANADHLNKTALFYNWISAASYGGLGGIVSLAARYPLDIHFRNNLQGAIFPLDEIVSSYSTVAANVADALANDPTADPVKIISRAFTDIITKNTQIGRTIFNNAVNAGVLTERSSNPEIAESVFEKQQADKLNQLKHFKQVNELPLNPVSDFAGNPYLNMEQKTFKHQTDVGKAVATLPEIIQHYIQYYGAKSPDILMNKLEGLKANPYDVFPSIETEPLVFARYLGFLQKKFGQQEANSLLADYMKRRTINEAKASVVP